VLTEHQKEVRRENKNTALELTTYTDLDRPLVCNSCVSSVCSVPPRRPCPPCSSTRTPNQTFEQYNCHLIHTSCRCPHVAIRRRCAATVASCLRLQSLLCHWPSTSRPTAPPCSRRRAPQCHPLSGMCCACAHVLIERSQRCDCTQGLARYSQAQARAGWCVQLT
jgi:hypothetical protein